MAQFSRRGFVAASLVLALACPTLAQAPRRAARMRIILDNDFGGDPDGLFQLAHFALSPSVELPLIIGSHYRDFGEADRIPDKASASVAKAAQLLGLLGQETSAPLVAGSPHAFAPRAAIHPNDASAAIIHEAMREDADMPLFYAAAGSLTEIARAWLAEPRIGSRLRLVWIGGAEHPDLAAPPPGHSEPEYNFNLDRLAAQIIFNQSDIEIWQVPRNAFRQMLLSHAELEELAHSGPLGRFLGEQVAEAHARLAANLPAHIFNEGESFMLGDTALVTLTALQSAFQQDTSSSQYAVRPTPFMQQDGSYEVNPAGRPMRVYTQMDTRLTFADMTAKIRTAGRAGT